MHIQLIKYIRLQQNQYELQHFSQFAINKSNFFCFLSDNYIGIKKFSTFNESDFNNL